MTEEHDDKKKPKVIGDYRIGKVLGTGSYGYVRQGVNIVTGEQFAIKTLKDTQNKKGIQREIAILKLLDHPNIVKLYDVIEDAKSGIYYLVLELAGGGELFDYIVARGRLREKEARKFFRQIISGVEYCHSSLVIHRDLKPENLLLDVDGNIKINDFGFSNIMIPGERFSTFCGSVSYVAPEIIKNIKYVGPEIDIWSIGVILYTLVCGRLPWPETSDGSPAITNIIEGDYDIVPLNGLSEGCRDLIAKILVPAPSDRATLSEIRNHPWVNEGYSGPPPCLVHEFPPLTTVNEEILVQLVKIGFEDSEHLRSRLLSNERCPEVAVYNLLMQKYFPQERPQAVSAALNSNSGSDDESGIPEVLTPSKSGSAIGRFGSGRRFDKRKSTKVQHSPVSSYGSPKTSLEGLAAAIRRNTVTSETEAGLAGSDPIRRHAPENRFSLGPIRSNVHSDGTSSAGTSPPGVRHSALHVTSKPNRKSVIITLGTSFKSFFSTTDKIKEVKGIFSVDTTTSAPPTLVVEEVIRVLELEKENTEEFRLKYKQKGYVFKCKYPAQHLAFVLEVCKIRKMDLTGVKSKRLKGDLWVYKDYCQRIITKLRL